MGWIVSYIYQVYITGLPCWYFGRPNGLFETECKCIAYVYRDVIMKEIAAVNPRIVIFLGENSISSRLLAQ